MLILDIKREGEETKGLMSKTFTTFCDYYPWLKKFSNVVYNHRMNYKHELFEIRREEVLESLKK